MYQLVLELIEIIQVTFQHSSVFVSTYDGFHLAVQVPVWRQAAVV